jgi:8-oxo-dGTP pyrophosphatase MutT (NUDIX family)
MVLGFAFDPNFHSVLLIRKNRPSWQAGKLNGIGGHCKAGESFVQAMEREFKEEAGVVIPQECDEDTRFWRSVGEMGDHREWLCQIFAIRLVPTEYELLFKEISPTDEQIVWITVANVMGVNPDRVPVIPNLRWIVPLCIDALRDVTLSSVRANYFTTGLVNQP